MKYFKNALILLVLISNIVFILFTFLSAVIEFRFNNAEHLITMMVFLFALYTMVLGMSVLVKRLKSSQ